MICSVLVVFLTVFCTYSNPDRTNYLRRSVGYSGAVLLNEFPSQLRKPLTLTRFRKGLSDIFLNRHLNSKHSIQ